MGPGECLDHALSDPDEEEYINHGSIMTMSDGGVTLPPRWRIDTISRPEHMIQIASSSVKIISLFLDKNYVH